MIVKNRLLDLRLEKKFKKQKDFAAYLNLKPSYYNKLENNKSIMTIDTLVKISRKLNISLDEIIEVIEEDS